jgi:hypothetical protein
VSVQQNPETSVYQTEMFRLDPSGEHSVEEVIAKLTDILADLPPDSPRASKLAEMIRVLRKTAKEPHTEEDAPAAGTG